MPVSAENLSKAFGGRPVLSSFSHTFPDGSVTCIVGPSGCGKTTLLNLIMGLIPPDSGSVSIPEGRTIAAVFQEDRLFEHCSAAANLRAVLHGKGAVAAAGQALEAVGLGGFAAAPVRTLSGGMKRRVAILRALLADADILLMDEPFRGLDADTRCAVIRWMLPRLRGKTVLIVTHYPSEIPLLGDGVVTLPLPEPSEIAE